MPTALRAFLLMRAPSGDWDIQVFHDLEDVVHAWDMRAEPHSTAVLHCGFTRRVARSFEEIGSAHPGQVLLTPGGRYALPSGFKSSVGPVGYVEEEAIFLGLEGWGYSVLDPPEPAKFSLPSFTGWIGDYIRLHEHDVGPLLETAIFDEESYARSEGALSSDLREKLGRFRLEMLIGGRDQDPCLIARNSPPWAADRLLESFGLTVRLSNVFQRQGIRTIADLGAYSTDDLYGFSNFGRRSARDLVEAVNRAIDAGIQSHEVVVHALTGQPLLEIVDQTLSRLTDRQRDILRRRMGWDGPPQTLAEIGDFYHVTRERIRQIEEKTVKRIVRDEYWDDLLADKLAVMLKERDYPLPVMGAEALDPWFEGFAGRLSTVRYLLANMCGGRVSTVSVEGVDYLSFLTADQWLEIVNSGRKFLEGSVDQQISRSQCRQLVMGLLPEHSREFAGVLWEKASHLCHFAGDGDEEMLVAYGRGADHIVEAVLEQSDRPLHFSEIAVLASKRAGRAIDERRAHGAAAEVGLVLGRGTYGLARHLGLETNALMDLANEASSLVRDGPTGRQWHASELAAAIADTEFSGVERPDKYAVNAALTLFGSLKDLGRLIWIDGDASGDGARMDIRQAIVATLQQAGAPLSSAELYQRLVAIRGINEGWALGATDPVLRLGSSLWGLNDRDVPIKRADQPELADSVVTRLEAMSVGQHVSELSEFLIEGLSPRGLLSLLALDSRLHVSTAQYVYLEEWGGPRRPTVSAACIETLRNFGPIPFEDLHLAVTKQVGRPFPRTALSSTLQSISAKLDRGERWILVDEEEWPDLEA